ncbi:MAG: NUDIX domain-containing protein [Opitutales bacterium]
MSLIEPRNAVSGQRVLPAQNEHEYFDVVDPQDRVIGRERRAVVHARGLYHRAVHILVVNSTGQLLLQRRSLSKDTNPGKWTTACCGHVDAGEDYLQAAHRELTEELGIAELPPEALREVWRHRPCRATGMEFIRVYRLLWDGDLLPDPQEISELRWLSSGDLSEAIAERPRVFTASLRLIWTHCASALA